jgi:hypothetical protein
MLYGTLAPSSLTLEEEDNMMAFTMPIPAVTALVAGILILLIPRLLNYIVAVYLIVIGLLGLFP